MNHRVALAWAGILGATGVAAGAAGAHALRAALAAAGTAGAWETAVRFHLVHACALVGLAGWMRASAMPADWRAAWAAWLWALGTVLFSGSLYPLALGGPHGLVYVTPFGGVALIAGWVLAASAALAA